MAAVTNYIPHTTSITITIPQAQNKGQKLAEIDCQEFNVH